jgi:hypothetical protein
MAKIPTIGEYIENEWQESEGLPGPAYQLKYGLRPTGNNPIKAPGFDSRRGIPLYGDCCDNEKQYVRYEVWQEALQEINRLKLAVAFLEAQKEA